MFLPCFPRCFVHMGGKGGWNVGCKFLGYEVEVVWGAGREIKRGSQGGREGSVSE
jgi:hypothetical protein